YSSSDETAIVRAVEGVRPQRSKSRSSEHRAIPVQTVHVYADLQRGGSEGWGHAPASTGGSSRPREARAAPEAEGTRMAEDAGMIRHLSRIHTQRYQSENRENRPGLEPRMRPQSRIRIEIGRSSARAAWRRSRGRRGAVRPS